MEMKIKVYRLSTCHWCDAVEEFLKEHGFSYESITVDNLDHDEQERIISEVYTLTGQRSFPVTLLDGSPVIGFDEKKLRRFLNLPHIEVPRKAAARAVKEIFTSDQREAVKQWALGMAEGFGCLFNPKEEDLVNILDGLIKNERRYGYRSCPCRFAAGEYKKDADIICPCAYLSWDIEVYEGYFCSSQVLY